MDKHSPYPLDTHLARLTIGLPIALGILAFTTLVLRLIARTRKRSQLGADDMFIIAASVCTLANLGLTCAMVKYGGMGNHINNVNSSDELLLKKLAFSSQPIWVLCMGFVKLSILLLYLRIFGAERKFRIASYIVIGWVVTWIIYTILLGLLVCRPLPALFDQTANVHCGNLTVAWRLPTSINLVTDFMILILPIPVIWKLQMNMEKKLGLLFVFFLGGIVTVISILRLVLLDRLGGNQDATYYSAVTYLWSIIEPEIAIIGANLPVLGPRLKNILKNVSFTTSKSQKVGGSDVAGGVPLSSIHQRSHHNHRPLSSSASSANTRDDKSPKELYAQTVEEVPSTRSSFSQNRLVHPHQGMTSTAIPDLPR